MATQQEDGRWKSETGINDYHSTKAGAEARDRNFRTSMGSASAGAGQSMGSFLDMAGKWIILLPLLGLLALLGLVAIAFLKGFVILAVALPLFGISALIGLAFGCYAFLKCDGFIMRFFALIFVTLIVTAPLCWVSYKIYGRTSKHFTTMYSADYIQALPDGSVPRLYEKRFQKGKVLAELSIDERVTVNGITINSKEYNITTQNGITGWVVRDAFPKNAAEMLGIAIDVGGFDQQEVQTDRFVERLMEKYMDKIVTRQSMKGVPLEYRYEVSQDMLNRSIRVNVQTPYLHLTSAEYREGGTLRDIGEKVTLANILYADDATIIYVTAPRLRKNDMNMCLSGAQGNTNAWRNGLIVTCLNTGEVYRALQADYWKTHNIVSASGQPTISGNVFFFPPFKTRHFSLTREVLPMPVQDEIKEGYGGLLGLINNFGAGNFSRASGAVNYNHWEFPEVRVR